MSLSEPGPWEARWQAVAQELTPAKSLARIDTATARVVSTVSVLATVLTGLGLVAADRVGAGPARLAAVATVMLAVAALVCALAAQAMTITRRLNTNNLAEVEAWYRIWFTRRAPLTRAAGILLLAAAVTGGLAGLIAVTDRPEPAPVLTLTRTVDLRDDGSPTATGTVVVMARASGLDPGQVMTLTVTGAAPLAQVAVGAGGDGTAEREIIFQHVPGAATITVHAEAGGRTRGARSLPGQAWRVTP